MPTPSDFQEPLDHLSADQALLRVALQSRVAYLIQGSEDPQDFVAVDPNTGAQTLVLLYNGGIFFFDSTDVTSLHDGVTVLVSNDGHRYLRENAVSLHAVLDIEEEPPGSPTLGDVYIVATAATGDWATHDDEIAVFTARGWEFIPPSIGMLIFVEDSETFMHYTAAGAWSTGLSNTPIADETVLPSSVLGGRIHWIVENQTTNTPPAAPGDGDTYIIGPAPEDDWAGHAGKIALARGGNWIIVTPTEGYQAYDKSTNRIYTFTGAEWALPATGLVVISAQEVAAVAQVDFVDLFDGQFSEYELVCTGVTVSVDDVDIRLRVRVNGVYESTGYLNDTGAITNGVALNPTNGQGNAADEKGDYRLRFADPDQSGFTLFLVDSVYFRSDGTVGADRQWGYFNDNDPLNAIRVVPVSGNISGRFVLYGRAKDVA